MRSFHPIARCRQSVNVLSSITMDAESLEGPQAIKVEVFNYFKHFFTKELATILGGFRNIIVTIEAVSVLVQWFKDRRFGSQLKMVWAEGLVNLPHYSILPLGTNFLFKIQALLRQGHCAQRLYISSRQSINVTIFLLHSSMHNEHTNKRKSRANQDQFKRAHIKHFLNAMF